MKLIITGFEPIWGIKKTPSGDLAKLWDSGSISVPGVEIKSIVLPQLFKKCTDILISEMDTFKPDAILMYGATKKNNPVRFERFALNVELSSMGDNSRIPVNERSVNINGPAAYYGNWPVDYIIKYLDANGVHAITSQFAGTHVCNSIYYGIMHHIVTNNLPTVAGFIHMSFPNEYGVVEDGMWTTPSFGDLTKTSILTVKGLNAWFNSKR